MKGEFLSDGKCDDNDNVGKYWMKIRGPESLVEVMFDLVIVPNKSQVKGENGYKRKT